MVDQLITVDSDRGPIEPDPVTVFFNGQAVDFASLLGGESILNSTAAPAYVHRLPSSIATTNATLVRPNPTRLFRISGTNANAAARYLKLYNKTTLPVVGTDLPFWVETLEASAPFSVDLDGLLFSNGLGYAITTNFPDSDTGPVSSGDIVAMNISYLY